MSRSAAALLVVAAIAIAVVVVTESTAGGRSRRAPASADARPAAVNGVRHCAAPKPLRPPLLPATPGSAIVGYVTLSGGPPDPCGTQALEPNRPYAGAVTVADGGGHVVARVTVRRGQLFAIPVAPGKYTVRATLPISTPPPTFTCQPLRSGRHPFSAPPGPFTVVAGGDAGTVCIASVP